MIKAYKGFDKDLKCRGFQYEIGGEYEEEKAKACECGFHACEMPLNVLDYYAPGLGSRYCEVEQSGTLSRHGSDSKVASSKIKIGAEIGIAGLVKAQIEWVKSQIDFDHAIEKADKSKKDKATGYQGAASATGTSCVALTTGYCGRVMGSLGNAIVCCERGEWDGNTYPLLSICSAIVDGEKIKPDTWYTVKNGEFVEVE